jgi:hypothetical protein
MNKRIVLLPIIFCFTALLLFFISHSALSAIYTYTYDDISRLDTITTDYGSYTISEQYVHDPAGNRTSLTIISNSGQPPAPGQPSLSTSTVIRGQTIVVTGDVPNPGDNTVKVEVSMDGGATWYTASCSSTSGTAHWPLEHHVNDL